MKQIKKIGLVACCLFLLWSCQPSNKTQQGDDGIIEITMLQINDVYEIAPLEGGNVGGMARVAQVKKELLAKNPNTVALMAGDFLNPSVIGSLKYEGERVKGKQMVEAMNSAGIDFATFGNHEFDLDEEDLLKRLEESEFQWFCANVRQRKGSLAQPFKQQGKAIPDYWIKTFTDADGTTLKVGFIGICLDANQKEYVLYEDAALSFQRTYAAIKNQVDFVVGLTHQSIESDLKLAALIPDVPLLMGGHEHTNMKHKVGNVVVTKADANAKTAYIHQFKYNKNKKRLTLNSVLKPLNETVALEAETDAVVQKWADIAAATLKTSGIDANATIIDLKKPLDAREEIIRYQPSPVSTIIVDAIREAYEDVDGAILNTGSIRLDDVLTGRITEYDIVRLMPFGGGVELVEMKGSVLLQTLETGLTKNVGKGGYLALSGITYNTETKTGTINNNRPINPEQFYLIALPSFLLTGLEMNLDFLKENPNISTVSKPTSNLQKDVRIAVINYLKKNPL